MILHKDKAVFEQVVRRTSNYYKIDPALIEKDYYITLVLYEINKYIPGLLFKGGTSLSKCYKVIDRFSEDIDLTLDRSHFTQSNRQKLKRVILDVCKDLHLFLMNEKEIKSRRAYNCYRIEYPMIFSLSSMNPQLIVETVFIQKFYPEEVKTVSSMIGEWLQETNQQVSKLLQQMVDTEFFKKDYEENTLKLIFYPISYEEAIQAIESIFNSRVFE